jgi:hypothetical protein
MRTQYTRGFSRRRFLGGVTLAGTAGLLGVHPRPVAAEPPPETTTLRLVKIPSICQAPQYVAEELLKSEGFTEVIHMDIRPAGGLGLLLDIFHGFAMTSWAPNRGQASSLFLTELRRTHRPITDGLIDPHRFTADRAAIMGCLRRRATRFVQGLRQDRRGTLATQTSLSSVLPAPPG